MRYANLIPRDTTIDSGNVVNIVSRQQKLHLSELTTAIFATKPSVANFPFQLHIVGEKAKLDAEY